MARAKQNGYTDWETPDQLEKIEAWASEGLTRAEIAHNMGIGRNTFCEWRKKSPCIEDAIKRGEDSAIDKVENALFSAACSGNITAQIFFLKNKRPDAWKDKRDTEISGGNGGKVSFEWGTKEKPSYINKEENSSDGDDK